MRVEYASDVRSPELFTKLNSTATRHHRISMIDLHFLREKYRMWRFDGYPIRFEKCFRSSVPIRRSIQEDAATTILSNKLSGTSTIALDTHTHTHTRHTSHVPSRRANYREPSTNSDERHWRVNSRRPLNLANFRRPYCPD